MRVIFQFDQFKDFSFRKTLIQIIIFYSLLSDEQINYAIKLTKITKKNKKLKIKRKYKIKFQRKQRL